MPLAACPSMEIKGAKLLTSYNSNYGNFRKNLFCPVCGCRCMGYRRSEASFFSVYLHQVSGGVDCVADLPTLELAKQLAELIENACKSYSKI